MYTSPAISVKHKRFYPLNAFALGFLLSLVVSTPVVADDTEIFFSSDPNTTVKPNVLFILDTSGSMTGTDNTSPSITRLQRMKDALTTLLNNVTNVNVGLMRFNGSNGGGPVLFPLSYIDADMCDVVGCSTKSLTVSVSRDSDDAEETSSGGTVTLDSTELNIVEDSALADITPITIENFTNVNDTEERADGTLHTNSPDLDLFYTGAGSDNHRAAGIRFQNVVVPKDAIITNAEIVFTIEEKGRGDLNIDIYGDAADDSVVWNESDGEHVTDRAPTAAKVNWDNIPNPNANQNTTTSSLAPIVQEIVNRPGWVSGNDMTFLLFPDSTSNWKNFRRFYSYNGDASKGPKLRVSYIESLGGVDISQVVGLRFDGVAIPQGANITSAYLEFEASEAAGGTALLTITPEIAVNPPTFTNEDRHISTRFLAAYAADPLKKVDWTGVENWDTKGGKFRSPDISDIVKDIVDQPTFCGGNAMVFFLTGSGSRLAVPHEGAGAPPALRITYDTSELTTGEGCMTKTITKTISQRSDDAEEDTTDGGMSLGSDTLDLITSGGHEQLIGLRFRDLDIAQGAEITEAKIQFEVDTAGSGSINLTILGHDVDDADTFTNSDDSISDRIQDATKTSAEVSWNITENPGVNSKLTTPDIKTVVKEIVDRDGWAAGNDMAFIIKKASGSGKRTVESRDGESSAAPRLTVKVKWNEGDLPSVVQTVRNGLINQISNLDATGGTPIVDAYYEAARYYRGEGVDYGTHRGTSTTTDSAKSYRVSNPATYTGGNVVREAGCTDDNLSSTACKTERIDDSPIYTSPITDSCQKTSHIVLLSDGEPTSNSAADKVKTMADISSCTASGDQECGAELSHFLLTEDQSTAKTGSQTIKTYTIGFELTGNTTAVNFLKSLASPKDDNSPHFYEASSSASLVAAIEEIFDEFSTSTSTFVAPGAAVNQFNRLIHDDKIYFSIFKPNNKPFWNGNLKKYQISTDALLDVNGSVAVDEDTGLFKDSAKSFWSDVTDGNEVGKGGAAAERSSSATRKVYTYVSGSSSTTLSHNDNKMVKTNDVVSTGKLGLADSDTTLRDNILDWVSGKDVRDYDGDKNTTETRLQFGDPLHSKPVIVTYGGTAAAPDSTIFFGTNEGYIHAIDADDGSEEFSYIPEELLPNLEDLYTNRSATTHPYGMDGTVVIWAHDSNGDNDYYDTTGDDSDHVYLYTGMRRGGKSYYALNITDRANPVYMWKVTGGSGTFAELAQTWSTPVRSKVNIGGTTYDALIVGGGYDDDQDNTVTHATRQVDSEGRAIFIIDAVNGNLLWQGALTGVEGTHESFTDMKYSIPAEVRVIDINLDGYADMMFAADVGGQVWRFDIHNGSSAEDLVTGGVIADIGADDDTANNRRFFTTPDIALVKEGASKFLTISIGSGWRAHPLNEDVDDRFYVIRDSNWGSAPDTYTKLTESNLVDVTNNIDANNIATAITDGKKGWYITLENDGEKVLSNSVTVNNQVIFSTYTPEPAAAACTASEGSGRTYVVSVYNGRPTVNFDLLVNSDPNNLTKDDRVVTLQRGGIPPEATVLFAPDPVVLIGPEMPLSDLPFGDIAQRTYWYQEAD